MSDIIAELEEIAMNAGDTMGRDGEYISDNIRRVINTLKTNFNL